jgi:hypothetical protein
MGSCFLVLADTERYAGNTTLRPAFFRGFAIVAFIIGSIALVYAIAIGDLETESHPGNRLTAGVALLVSLLLFLLAQIIHIRALPAKK